jgi:hypothetical protein
MQWVRVVVSVGLPMIFDNPRTIIPPEPDRTCKVMRMTGSKKYSPVDTKDQPVWGSIFDQRKSQLYHFTIGFQKPGICTDSWFLESNGKMVQLGFCLSADFWFLESNGRMVQLAKMTRFN